MNATTGCGNKPEATSSGTAQSSASAKGETDKDRVQRFLTELEAQPADQRKGYVDKHPTEAAMASQSQDRAVSEKFYNLMMPKMVMPK